MKGTFMLSILMLCMSFGLLADVEPNDNTATANPLSLATLQAGTLLTGDNNDYYLVTLPANGSMTITLNGGGGSLNARAYILNGTGGSLGATAITSMVATFSADCMAPGTYYVRVEKWSGTGSYTIQADYTAPNLANDAEPNDAINTTNFIAEDVVMTGQMGYFNGGLVAIDGNDWYYTVLTTNGRTTATLDCDNGMTGRVWLYNKSGSSLAASSISGDETTVTVDCIASDTLYIRVERWTGCGSYEVSYDHESSEFPTDNEPNDALADAIPLAELATRRGNLGYFNGSVSIDGNDWYGTTIDRNGMVEVTVIPTNGMTLRVWEYNADGSSLGASSITGDTATLTINCVGEGPLYFRVERWTGCGSYKISYRIIDPILTNDVEPNDIREESNAIAENEVKTGHIGYLNGTFTPNDNYDWYYSVLVNDGAVTATIRPTEGLTARLWVFNKAGTTLGTTAVAGSNDTASVTIDCIAEDTIYLRVERWANCGTYSIDFDLIEPVRNNDNEPNNDLASANSLSANIGRQGHLGYFNDSPADNNDWYVFDSEEAGPLTLTCVMEETLNARIWLYNSSGGSLAVSSITNDTAVIDYTATVDDLFYVRVERWSACGSYLLKYDNKCPRPTNLRPDPAISVGAILKWNAVGAADKYRLQKRVVGAPSWDPNLNVNIPKYIWYPLDECTDYEFRVESRCGDRNSSFSPIEEFQTLCSPVCFTPTSVFVNMTTTTTAQIGWVGQPIDIGYRVQYVVDGDFSTIFEKTSSGPMIELTGLTPGTNYLFRVNAFCLGMGVSGFQFGSFTTATIREGSITQNLELYPNPASTSVMVTLETENNLIEIINAIGQVVFTAQSTGLQTQLDISELETGLYQVRATDEAGTTTATSGLVIKR